MFLLFESYNSLDLGACFKDNFFTSPTADSIFFTTTSFQPYFLKHIINPKVA